MVRYSSVAALTFPDDLRNCPQPSSVLPLPPAQASSRRRRPQTVGPQLQRPQAIQVHPPLQPRPPRHLTPPAV